ncbi:MAG TPA: FAD-binding oxidoreductase, partial [Puia sp.]|nr:FAD-binding oxidoreductase [Puia sp.]
METWTLRVTAIHPEALDTKTFFLQRVDGGPFLYQAGQFLTLLFTFHDHELRRSYSFSTTPGVDPIPAITVKRIPNGEISRHLLDHVQPGDTLTALPPAGRFVLPSRQPGPSPGSLSPVRESPGPLPERADLPPEQFHLCMIAAGSGLVPIFSLIKHALVQQTTEEISLSHPPPPPITLITQPHEPASTPVRQALTTLQATYGPS